MKFPVLFQHSTEHVVGEFDGTTGILTLTADAHITTETMFNAGWRVLEADFVDGVQYLRRAEIVEFSVGNTWG